jgi:hypothetical protein
LAARISTGGSGTLTAAALTVAVAARSATCTKSIAGRPARRFERLAAGALAGGRTTAVAPDGDVHAGQGIARGLHSGGRGRYRVGGDAVMDHELCLHDLAGATGHDHSNVAEVRIAYASLDGRAGGRLVRVDRLDGLVHQLVRRVGQVD